MNYRATIMIPLAAGEQTNRDRAARVAPLVAVYRRATEPIEDNYTTATDLLADLMHWCDLNDVTFDAAVNTARSHYQDERTEPVEQCAVCGRTDDAYGYCGDCGRCGDCDRPPANITITRAPFTGAPIAVCVCGHRYAYWACSRDLRHDCDGAA